jgi:hypothetical protein|tara:strand:+ start:6249 stop:6533 length:285 start_codon:yes stop_codon:yes gene_type:complete
VESFPEPANSTESITITPGVYDDNLLVTGLLDSELNIWIRNLNDPNDWKRNLIQNNYHQNLSNIIIITEISHGKYSFVLTIPEGIDINPKMRSL